MNSELFLSFSVSDREKFTHHVWDRLLISAADTVEVSDLALEPFSEENIRACFHNIEGVLSMLLDSVCSDFMTAFRSQNGESIFESILGVYDYITTQDTTDVNNLLCQYVHLLAINSCFSKYHIAINKPKRMISALLVESFDPSSMQKNSQGFRMSACHLIAECLFLALINTFKEPQFAEYYRTELISELDIIMRGCLL